MSPCTIDRESIKFAKLSCLTIVANHRHRVCDRKSSHWRQIHPRPRCIIPLLSSVGRAVSPMASAMVGAVYWSPLVIERCRVGVGVVVGGRRAAPGALSVHRLPVCCRVGWFCYCYCYYTTTPLSSTLPLINKSTDWVHSAARRHNTYTVCACEADVVSTHSSTQHVRADATCSVWCCY